jgi:hypothetical protein
VGEILKRFRPLFRKIILHSEKTERAYFAKLATQAKNNTNPPDQSSIQACPGLFKFIALLFYNFVIRQNSFGIDDGLGTTAVAVFGFFIIFAVS